MVHYKPMQLFRHQEQFLSLGDWQDLKKCPKIVNKLFILKWNMIFFHAAERAGPKTKFDPVKIVSKQWVPRKPLSKISLMIHPLCYGVRESDCPIVLGKPFQALKILNVLECLDRVYQVPRPGRAKIPLSWVFADKRIFPDFAFLGPKVDQICQFPKIWNQPQVNTYLDYQNMKFGWKTFVAAKVMWESHNFL